MIYYYSNVWKHRVYYYICERQLCLTDEHQTNFDAVGQVIGREVLVAFPTPMLRSNSHRRVQPKLVTSYFNTERVTRWRLVLEEFGPASSIEKRKEDSPTNYHVYSDDDEENINFNEYIGYNDNDIPPNSFPIRHKEA